MTASRKIELESSLHIYNINIMFLGENYKHNKKNFKVFDYTVHINDP